MEALWPPNHQFLSQKWILSTPQPSFIFKFVYFPLFIFIFSDFFFFFCVCVGHVCSFWSSFGRSESC